MQSTGQCSVPPGEVLFSIGIVLPENDSDEERRILVYQSFVDTDYLATLGVSVTEGRNFDKGNAADSTKYILLNSAAREAIGDDVANRELGYPDVTNAQRQQKSAVGFFNDFSFASFHDKVQPMMLEYNPARCGYLLVRIESGDAKQVLAGIESTWKQNIPEVPFDYYFLDQGFARFYENETRQKTVIGGIAIIAICLAALGIFGTTLFVVEKRSREAGIRKILGSGKAELLTLLIKPTFRLVVISCIIGIPIAYTLGDTWLSKYPFHVELSPLFFIVAFAIISLVVTGTILYHLLRLTRLNPVDVLRENS